MNLDWKAFLKEKGAEFVVNSAEFETISFDSGEETPISAQDLLLINSSERGLIKVTGDDAESFLQNQLTNDIRNVSENNHQLSAWCSPKGRIIATFHIFKRDGAFYLALSRDLIEHVTKKLRMYVMMSKVVIEDLTESGVSFTFSGIKVTEHLETILAYTFSSNNEVVHQQSLSLVYTHDELSAVSRIDIFTDNIEEAKSLWTQLEAVSNVVDDRGLQLLNITAGLPEITAQSTEDWIPQMVNYIQVKGVDFKKGCYPGQEVVARLNYLGKTKRRMYRVEIDTQQLPVIGADIKSDTDDKVGKVLSAALNENAKVEALVVLKIAGAAEALSIVDNEASISVLELPYTVEDE